jgi:hypothetical protein
MGYNTTFKGQLKFTCEPTLKMLAKLNPMMGEDFRDHKDWNHSECQGYIDLLLLDDFSGLRWNDGTEKTYGLVETVNAVIEIMRRDFPDFGLTGFLEAQGEDAEDRWNLVMGEDGVARKMNVPIPGVKVTCPDCHHKFYVETTPSNGGE